MTVAIKVRKLEVKVSLREGKMFAGNTMQDIVRMDQGVSLSTGVLFVINMDMGLTTVGEQMVMRNSLR